jgi:tRNA-2-methylthio-N6-dimethylallyladenosine synthase
VVIGVGGCVASQEGEAIVKRAPYVDLVFGPQTLHRLPQMIEARRHSGHAQVDISFPGIEKFDRLPEPRAEGPTAFVSIMEGCSKYCSYCVVPYTRGEEISRPFDDVVGEVAMLAEQGVREVNLLASVSPPRTRWNSPTRWSRPTPTCPSLPTTCTCRCRPAPTASCRR